MSHLINSSRSRRGWSWHGPLHRCEQEFAYKVLLGLDAPATPPLIRGALVHTYTAHYYARKANLPLPDGSLGVYHEPETAVQLVAEANGWDVEYVAEAIRVGRAYEQDYAFEQVKVVAVEKELEAQIDAPLAGLDFRYSQEEQRWVTFPARVYDFTLRVDLILADEHDRVWIVDTKTSQRMKSDTLKAFSLDGQFLGLQLFGAGVYGDRYAGTMVNVANLGGERATFNRARLEYAPAALAKFARNLARRRHRVAEMIRDGVDFYDFPAAFHNLVCRHPYGICEFFEVCRFGPGTTP